MNYPENPPPANTGPTWYKVKRKNGNYALSCWWLNVWYCDANWDKIIEWYEWDGNCLTEEELGREVKL